MNFTPLTLDDITELRPYFERNLCRICDCTIGGTFMWRDFLETEYALCDGLLYLKVKYLNGQTAFSSPRGEGALTRPALDRIIEYCGESGIVPRLCAVSSSRLEVVRELYPDSEYFTDRAWSDYLYEADKIKALPGRKYAGQRNHINRFMRENPENSFEAITEATLPEARDFFCEYVDTGDSEIYAESQAKTLEILDNYEAYGQLGGILRADGRIVGAAIGEIVGDTLFIHAEKADISVHGSYQMLVNGFSKQFASDEIKYINREEDDGVPGLRASKESYHPVALLSKYVVGLK